MQLRTTVIGLTLVVLSVSSGLAGCTSTSPSATSGPPSGSTPARSGPPSSPAPQHSDTPVPTPSPTPPAAASAHAAGDAGSCQTRHLVLTEDGMEGAAGSSYVTYHLKNVGPARCALNGYPGFALLRADGSVIQHPATRNTMPHRTVELDPGQQAEFVVRSLDPSNPDNGCSTDWKTAQVQVYPPNETTAIRQHSDVPACDLTVGPVTAG